MVDYLVEKKELMTLKELDWVLMSDLLKLKVPTMAHSKAQMKVDYSVEKREPMTLKGLDWVLMSDLLKMKALKMVAMKGFHLAVMKVLKMVDYSAHSKAPMKVDYSVEKKELMTLKELS